MVKNLKKRGIISLILFVLLAFSTCAYAANEPDISMNDLSLEITGCEEGAPSFANVSMVIYNPGYTSESINSESGDYVLQIKEAVFWMGQVNADRNGEYRFAVDMAKAEPGEYTIVIYSQGGSKTVQMEYFYFSEEQQIGFIDAISKAETWQDVKEYLALTDKECTTAKLFSLSDPLYFSADPDNLAKLLFARAEDLDPEDIEGFSNVLLECALADNLNSGNQFDIEDYFTLFNPDEDFADTYESKLNDSAKKNFTASFEGEELNTMADVAKAFEQKTFLAVVNNIKNWADVSYMIETHGDSDSVDLSMDKYEKCKDKEDLAVELAKKAPYTSVEDFDDTLVKQAKKINEATKGSSGSSGGGGGGGSKIGLGTATTLPQISADEYVSTKVDTAPKFSDIDSVAWAKESIEYLADKNIVSGTANGTFEPEREIKREEFITMLISAFATVDLGAECTFIDVSSSNWFYTYAATAQKMGVLSGYSDGRMGVGENITREDLAVLAYRMAVNAGVDIPLSNTSLFPDEESIADYAKTAVYGMKAAGIINGMGDGAFAPKAFCTRAQAARIIYGLMKLEGDI